MANPLYSDDVVAPKRRTPDDRARATLAHYYRSGTGGPWTTDHRAESEAFKADVYLGVSAIMRALQSVTAQITAVGTAGDLGHNKAFGHVLKALPTPHAHANDEQRRPVVRGPLVKLFERPNERETLAELLSKVVIQDMLTGNVLLWCRPDRVGRVREMFVLPTALCLWQPYYSDECPAGAWRVLPQYSSGWGAAPQFAAAAGALVPAHEVCHFRRPHPLYHWEGYSPVTACSRWVDLIEAIDGACWASMDEGITRGPLLLVPNMSQEEADRQNEMMRREKAGFRNHRKPWVMGYADVGGGRPPTIEAPDPPKDMEFLQGREQYAGLVLSLLGVPPIVAATKAAGGHAELYAAIKQFRDLTLVPTLSWYASKFTRGVLETWDDGNDDLRLQFDLPPYLNEDLAEQQKNRQQSGGIVTFNEARRSDNLPPFDDPEADTLPITVYLAKQQQKAAPPPDPMGGGGAPGEQDPEALLAGLTGGDSPFGGGPPEPDNPAAKGSLPPRGPQAKGFDLRAGVATWLKRKGLVRT